MKKLKHSVFLSKVFSFAFKRHCQGHHNASYDVCRDWLCRLAWFAENLLWYGGQAGT